jgi:pilus assembly protein Flp/PilA
LANGQESENKMINLLKRLHKDDAGQDLIEYALIALLIALGAVTGMGKLASSINNEFSKISGSLT